MTTQHIPQKQLADLVANRQTSDQARQIRAHLAECSECAAVLASLEQSKGLSSPPAEKSSAFDAVKPLNDTPPAGTDNASDRVIAVLSFDSRQLSPAFGVRSGQSVARQLLFSIGGHDLDLRVAPDDGAWIVSGQVLGDCDSGKVELRGENITERASMNELCEFFLPRVPPGSYSLLVYISQMEIEVPEFELRA